MSELNVNNYDEVLLSLLVNEKSILGFLSAIFNFLARRTDFYYVPEGTNDNMGFPPGVAEELVIKVLRSCDPKNWKHQNDTKNLADVNNEIMCSTVAQEVEVIAEDDIPDSPKISDLSISTNPNLEIKEKTVVEKASTSIKDNYSSFKKENTQNDDYSPPVIPIQRNTESYNGAVREKYSWSQTIMDLDVTVPLPSKMTSSKELKVTINSGDIYVGSRNGEVILKDKLPYKIKTSDSFWSVSEKKLMIHLEKVQERWWTNFLNGEEPIDLSKIDCSRPLDDLPEDHVAKVRELQWNQEQKMKGLPTSDDIRNIEILKKAWNADGSPFKGKPFDPNVLHQN